MSFQSEIARISLGFYMVLMCHTDADIASLLTLHWLKWVPLRNFLFLLFFFCIFPCPSYLLFPPFFLIFHYNCCRQGHRHKLVHAVIGMKGTITSGSSALFSPPREGDHARCRLHPWEMLFGVEAKVRAEIQTQNTMHGTNNGYRSWRLSLVTITELALAAGPRARPPPPQLFTLSPLLSSYSVTIDGLCHGHGPSSGHPGCHHPWAPSCIWAVNGKRRRLKKRTKNKGKENNKRGKLKGISVRWQPTPVRIPEAS